MKDCWDLINEYYLFSNSTFKSDEFKESYEVTSHKLKQNVNKDKALDSAELKEFDGGGIDSNLIFQQYFCPKCLQYEMNIYRNRGTLYLCECQNCGTVIVGIGLSEVLDNLKIIE